jgi:hypothetical protein
VGVTGDPANPANHGPLCAKRYALPQIQHAADQLGALLFRSPWVPGVPRITKRVMASGPSMDCSRVAAVAANGRFALGLAT